MDDPLPGRLVAGRYRVEERLGAGAMGAVYRARHATTGGEVALKFLHGHAADDEVTVKRFTLEAQNAARLHHPGTVRVLDFGNDRGLLFLALELVPGETLAQVMTREGALPWPRALTIGRQILDALRAAHEDARVIVHRDVKPGNIMLVAHGGAGDVVKLLDFGVSRALAGTGAGTAGMIGTPYYTAPEIWRGEGADPRADLYAVGAILYEMLVGRPPFVPVASGAGALVELMRLHLEAPRPDARALAPATPEPVARLVVDLLAAAREHRPPSARAAIARVDGLLGRAPSPERRTNGRARVVALVAAAALVLAAVATVVAVATAGPTAPPLAQCVPPDARATPDAARVVYEATLSDADHVGADGRRITTAGGVIARDRERVHAGAGDPGDQLDTRTGEAGVADEIGRVFDRTLAETFQAAIADGEPRVRVEIILSKRDRRAGGLCLTVLPD